MDLMLIFTFIGGIGLFLLGMRLMTDGLKVAAGDTLREILARGTATTPRGILAGIAITTAVQSSSAVIFATVGFVNAGLLTLFQAVGVIIGSNVGTTVTSWLVAIVGFNVDLQALAMPVIAIGVILRVTGKGSRRPALGDALTGFGIFFLGLDVLKETFDGFGEGIDLEEFAGHGILSLLAFTAIGIVLTVIMNSSSAALAITLTAAGSGLIPLNAAAAMVIGANVGTTSTALFAVIGASSNAKRAATAHVMFNAITGLIAFIALPALLWLVVFLASLFNLDPGPATFLAIFHTMTKLLGMAIFWPLTPQVVRLLEKRFISPEEDHGKPKHIKDSLASTPDLALDALNMELSRIGAMARSNAKDVLSAEGSASIERLAKERDGIDKLVLATGNFVNKVQTNNIPEKMADNFPLGVRIGRYYSDVAEHDADIAKTEGKLPPIEDEHIAAKVAEFKQHAAAIIDLSNTDDELFSSKNLKEAVKAFEHEYQQLKAILLRAGTNNQISVRQMVARLDELSAIRRVIDQIFKAAKHSRKFKKYRKQFKAENDAKGVNGDNDDDAESGLDEIENKPASTST
ncbi:MAG TPA: Na/Pi cotransporter family protein [Halothiobacillaceae bacterium]|nr:Na/Pi cotransporter family protein [Halothiobacillaceae bacterium]